MDPEILDAVKQHGRDSGGEALPDVHFPIFVAKRKGTRMAKTTRPPREMPTGGPPVNHRKSALFFERSRVEPGFIG
jgi:hypothetical protein